MENWVKDMWVSRPQKGQGLIFYSFRSHHFSGQAADSEGFTDFQKETVMENIIDFRINNWKYHSKNTQHKFLCA